MIKRLIRIYKNVCILFNLINLKLLLLLVIFMGYYLCAKNCVNHFSCTNSSHFFQKSFNWNISYETQEKGSLRRYIVTSLQFLLDRNKCSRPKVQLSSGCSIHNADIILTIWWILRPYVCVSYFFPFDLYNSSSPGKLFPFYKDDWDQIMGAHFPEMGLLWEIKTLQQEFRSIFNHGNKYLLNTYSA